MVVKENPNRKKKEAKKKRLTYFYVTITSDLEPFHSFNFETIFPKNENLFSKTGVMIFSSKYFHKHVKQFHIKLPCQNGPITKERNFATNYFIFLKTYFDCKNLYKKLP